MKSILSCAAIFVTGLSAQTFNPFEQMPQYFQAFQQSGQMPQVFEFHNGQLVGGTYLGVNLAEIDANRAKELKLRDAQGVEISRVEEGSPADKAGLKNGDVILEYNGQRVEGMEQFGRLVRETPSGREVKLLISRNGATQTVAATVATRKLKSVTAGNMHDFFPGVEMPEIRIPDMPQVFTTWRSPVLGVEAESLGTQLATYFGVKEGVLVRSVTKDSAAEKAGLKAGDVITKVDGTPVATSNELIAALRSASSKKTFSVDLTRDRHETSVSVTVDEDRAPRTRAIHNGVRM